MTNISILLLLQSFACSVSEKQPGASADSSDVEENSESDDNSDSGDESNSQSSDEESGDDLADRVTGGKRLDGKGAQCCFVLEHNRLQYSKFTHVSQPVEFD